ncbi:lipase family protein [Aureliella helgolandensis]|uniref:Lipase (Class 3) n=1 Tax=Aureliella helgolandensis TaxID=2527968 RepID=A0A518G7Y3_9BACT|nr:lipase family protein [Aureliella helgolandensis]QDV24697.1 Lipase (class 3) [Aureliella helgolandensis]
MAIPIVEEAIRVLSEPLQRPISELGLLQQSLLFAELSKISYYRPDIVWDAIDSVGFEHYEYFDEDGAQAYIFANQFDCVVVCRGTEPNEWNDIKADVNALAVVAETAGRVHLGFKCEVDDLWPRLERALKQNEKTLWFAGHSLGGAMATICAGRCKLSEIPANPEALFTFGSPRVGDNRYINFVKLAHYRWVNNNDVVCRVPPPWLGYRHAGREMYFNAFGKLRKYRPWRRWRDRWYGFFMSLKQWKIDHLSDHAITLYIDSIQQAIHEEQTGKIRPVQKDKPT